jgi:type I restriction enzyme R subunit
MTERDVCTKYITPALINSGWDSITQIREEVNFTAGRIYVKGRMVQRGKAKRADYILYYKPNLPIAVIEAKDLDHTVFDGIQQALSYAESLDIPFVYCSNGTQFLEHDKTVSEGNIERKIELNNFPSSDELWIRYKKWKNIDDAKEKIISQENFYEINGKIPRYFQQVAINRTIEAIANGQNKILLVMATGTGKTYTAFQIIWRLWKSRVKKRILFLADRNILVDQTMTNDFKHFGDKMTKIQDRKVDKAYEIYLALYQAITGEEEIKNIYKNFSKDFFDLIIVDECHRGSAAEDSQWREILSYFSSATQIGMTATPKETKYISNIHYFGPPLYTYSLRQGIEDGFLAPYKVIRVSIDKDIDGWRPPMGKTDIYGNEVPDEVYNVKDFDRKIVIEERTFLVAKKITEFLNNTNILDKTIVFCADIEHAKRMHFALTNENPEQVNISSRYIMRITGDNQDGKMELDNFITPESRYPVIAITSKLMTTGVDAQTCKLIVIDKNINSVSEFKQIIGRGTRIREDFNKYYFTIIDFRQATNLFSEPDFDGDPVLIYEPKPEDPIVPPENAETEIIPDDAEVVKPDININNEKITKQTKIYVNGVEMKIINERIQYIGVDGKLITESLKDYSKMKLKEKFSSLDEFLTLWSGAEKKKAIIDELSNQGIMFFELEKEIGKKLDPFDLICHLAFDKPPLTRKERAENVKKRNYFTKYGTNAKIVLDALLDKYADEGIENIESMEVLNVQPFNLIASPVEIVNDFFGGREKYLEAIKELENFIYKIA